MNKEEREEIRAEARRELKRINQEFDEKTILRVARKCEE